MILGHNNPQQSAYYARNPVLRTGQYAAASVAPHGSTTRDTYTVPTGKRAFLETMSAQAMRQTAAAPIGLVQADVRLDPTGAEALAILCGVIHQTNTVGWREWMALSGGGVLVAGDVLTLVTIDASTGGTVGYILSRKLTEYEP